MDVGRRKLSTQPPILGRQLNWLRNQLCYFTMTLFCARRTGGEDRSGKTLIAEYVVSIGRRSIAQKVGCMAACICSTTAGAISAKLVAALTCSSVE